MNSTIEFNLNKVVSKGYLYVAYESGSVLWDGIIVHTFRQTLVNFGCRRINRLPDNQWAAGE